MTEIESRKRDHIRISLDRDVSFKEKTSWFEYVELVHNALPELDVKEVKTDTTFLNRGFSAPFLIEGMTGGTEEAEKINGNIAEAASIFGVPAGVGSQRAAIRNPELVRTFRVARERAPDGFLIANIGGVQLVEHGAEIAVKAVEMIEANAIAIHLNPLQELIQPGGDTNFRGVLRGIERVKNEVGVPVIVKEIGCGLSGSVVQRLEEAGVDAVDVAGSGGTNWTLIEMIRAEESEAQEKADLGRVFMDWGIPTAAATVEARTYTSLPIVSSGGIRTGLEAAKALTLGADMVGLAHPVLEPALKGVEEVLNKLNTLRRELTAAMFLTGYGDVESFKKYEPVIIGPLLEWIRQRCRNHPKFRRFITRV